MQDEELLDMSRRVRTFTAWAYATLSRPDNVGALKTGQMLVYVALHHHADLRLHHRDGYRHTTAADVAQLTRVSTSTASGHLARLALRHWIRRLDLPGGRVAYRPETRAEEWIA